MLRFLPLLASVSVAIALTASGGIAPAQAGERPQAQALATVSAGQGPARVAQAAPLSPRTYAGLQAASLSASDLPGYTLDYEAPGALDGTQQVFADYDADWVTAGANPSSVNIGLTSLRQLTDPNLAPGELAEQYTEIPTVTDLGSQGIGVNDHALFYTQVENGVTFDVYRIYFRSGTVLVDLYTADPAGTGSLDRLLALAKIIAGRLVAPSAAGS